MNPPNLDTLELAFRRARAELDIRTDFPPEVLREAERAARERDPAESPAHADRTDLPFVTIDPPGSRDLDQAVHAERAGDGYRVRYAIADVGFWVDRGSAVEREAWLRGVTFYAPDTRESLYPPVLSQGAASLLPDQTCPAVVFDLRLDRDAELLDAGVERARVRSRALLTYAQFAEHVASGGGARAGTPGTDTLLLLGEIGPKRIERERKRGGVSLPIREQHVQQRAAAALGYELVYDDPNEAEEWNAQISLLTGHIAATWMLGAGAGLLRTMPPFRADEVAKFRRIALALGFRWPEGVRYGDFMHGLDPAHPRLATLVRQARRVLRGADYVALDSRPPEQPLHAALAWVYAHATAPLRRLADRYVLDLLVTLAEGSRPGEAEIATLRELPAVMNTAERKESRLERAVVDTAEAWTLRDRIGETFSATVIDVSGGRAEIQLEEPPVRAPLELPEGAPPELGARLTVRLLETDPAERRVRFSTLPDDF